jgi:exodeoxyribonuclease V alpha subunit
MSERLHADAARALHRLQAEGALRQVDADFAALLRERLLASPAVALAGALAMRAVAAGHSSVALGDIPRLLDALGPRVQLPEVDDWRAALRADPRVAVDGDPRPGTLLDFNRDRIALRRYARYEQALAERLSARAARVRDRSGDDAALHALLARLFARADAAAPDTLDRQALAVAMALRRRLLLVTGGPGTGKTTTVARLLAASIEAARLRGEPPPRIALAAPTDLAAGRIDADIAGLVPTQARTLHRLLGWLPGRVGFRHHAGHPLREDLVVVDEASMVDLPLMAKLVEAVPETATLVLIGDPDQLPAVEAGDVLGGLCAASGEGLSLPADDAGFATALLGIEVPVIETGAQAAPLAGARVHLLHGWRQAGAAPLQALAGALQRGDRDAVFAAFAGDAVSEDDAVLSRRHGDGAALAEALRREALPAFAAVRDADGPQQALALATRCRILTALRRGPFGAEHWNAWCAAELGGRMPYFHGRLLMIAANSERHGLYNGDLGVVWHDARGEAMAWFDTPQGLRAWRPAQLPAHASAYATTVHKAQGSEFERVLLILPDSDARVLSRELLYTALTRARRSVWLWGAAETVERALARRTWRESGLEARLRLR